MNRYFDPEIFAPVITFLAVAGLIFAIYDIFRKVKRNKTLAKQGVLFDATITRRRSERWRGRLIQTIDYTFVVNGRTYERRRLRVYADTFERLKQTDVVPIKYLASDPSQNGLAGNSDTADVDADLYFILPLTLMAILGSCMVLATIANR